jgi:hypothetical protein
MKFKDEQGIELEYTPLQDRLIKAGFDKRMLDKDESLITYRHNPKAGLIDTLKNAFTGLGHLNIPVFQHYSRKHRRRNPVYIEITEIIKPGEWIAFTPSIQVDKDTSLSGKMDFLTYIARLFTKLVRVFTGRKDKSQLESTLVIGTNSDKFKLSQGYYINSVQYYSELGDILIQLTTTSNDETPTIENTFAATPSILGKTDVVYISSD